MRGQVITLDKEWFRREREPAKAQKLIAVNPETMEELKDAPKLMTTKQLGALLGFAPTTVSEWCTRGELEARKIRGDWRITREAVARFLVKENLK